MQHWHEEWLRLAQINGLKSPAAERRIFALERRLEAYKEGADYTLEEVADLRGRVAELEQSPESIAVGDFNGVGREGFSLCRNV